MTNTKKISSNLLYGIPAEIICLVLFAFALSAAQLLFPAFAGLNGWIYAAVLLVVSLPFILWRYNKFVAGEKWTKALLPLVWVPAAIFALEIILIVIR